MGSGRSVAFASLALAAVTAVAGCSAATPTPGATGSSPASASPAGTAGAPTGNSATPAVPTATPSPTSGPVVLDLTVMTYNILTGRNDCSGCTALKKAGLGDELALDARMPGAAEKIALADPDIVGFQENEGPDQLPQAYLAPLLDGYAWAQSGQTVPIAVRSSRFEILDSGVEALETEPVTCTGRDRTDGRFVVWAYLREQVSGQELWVFNTHLHPYDTADCAALRAANVTRLLAVMEERNPEARQPQLVLGDFNAFHDEVRPGFTAHLVELAAAGMVDSAAVAERDDSDVPGASSAGWLTAEVKGRTQVKVVRQEGRHMDYVWVPRGTRVSSWQVLSGPGVEYRRISGVTVPYWPGVVPSDHSPVVARLTLAGEPTKIRP